MKGETYAAEEMKTIGKLGFILDGPDIEEGWGKHGHSGDGEELRLPPPRDVSEEKCLRKPSPQPALHPLQKYPCRGRELFCALRVVSRVPGVNPRGRLVRVPEPFRVEVVGGALFKIRLRGGNVLFCPVLIQRQRHVGHLEGGNGKGNGSF